MICQECNGRRETIYYVETDRDENTVTIAPKKGICRSCNGSGKMPHTNADRIRAMSDEELAVFLADEIDHGDCCGCKLDCATYECDKFEDSCHNAYYRWLKQPV